MPKESWNWIETGKNFFEELGKYLPKYNKESPIQSHYNEATKFQQDINILFDAKNPDHKSSDTMPPNDKTPNNGEFEKKQSNLKIIKEESLKEFGEISTQNYMKQRDKKERLSWERLTGAYRSMGRFLIQMPIIVVSTWVGFSLNNLLQKRAINTKDLRYLQSRVIKEMSNSYEISDYIDSLHESISDRKSYEFVQKAKSIASESRQQIYNFNLLDDYLNGIKKNTSSSSWWHKLFYRITSLNKDLEYRISEEEKKIQIEKIKLEGRMLLIHSAIYIDLDEIDNALKVIARVIPEVMPGGATPTLRTKANDKFISLDDKLLSSFWAVRGEILIRKKYFSITDRNEKQKLLTKAEYCFKKSSLLDEKNIHAIHGLGLVAYLEGNKQGNESIKHFERIIEVTPDYPMAYNNRADYLRVKGDFDLALNEIEKALRLKPDKSGFSLTKAEILYGKAEKLAEEGSGDENSKKEIDDLKDEACKIVKAKVQPQDMSREPFMKNNYKEIIEKCQSYNDRKTEQVTPLAIKENDASAEIKYTRDSHGPINYVVFAFFKDFCRYSDSSECSRKILPDEVTIAKSNTETDDHMEFTMQQNVCIDDLSKLKI